MSQDVHLLPPSPLSSTSFLLASHLSSLALGIGVVLLPQAVGRALRPASSGAKPQRNEGNEKERQEWAERRVVEVEREGRRGGEGTKKGALDALVLVILFLIHLAKVFLQAWLSHRSLTFSSASTRPPTFLLLVFSHTLVALCLAGLVFLLWSGTPRQSKRERVFLAVLGAALVVGLGAVSFADVELVFEESTFPVMVNRIVGLAGSMASWLVFLLLALICLSRSHSHPSYNFPISTPSTSHLFTSYPSLLLLALFLPFLATLTSSSLFWLLVPSSDAPDGGGGREKGWVWGLVLPAGDGAAVILPLLHLLPSRFFSSSSSSSLPPSSYGLATLRASPAFFGPSSTASASSHEPGMVSLTLEEDMGGPPTLPRLSQLGSAAGSFEGTYPPAAFAQQAQGREEAVEVLQTSRGKTPAGEGERESQKPSLKSRWSGETESTDGKGRRRTLSRIGGGKKGRKGGVARFFAVAGREEAGVENNGRQQAGPSFTAPSQPPPAAAQYGLAIGTPPPFSRPFPQPVQALPPGAGVRFAAPPPPLKSGYDPSAPPFHPPPPPGPLLPPSLLGAQDQGSPGFKSLGPRPQRLQLEQQDTGECGVEVGFQQQQSGSTRSGSEEEEAYSGEAGPSPPPRRLPREQQQQQRRYPSPPPPPFPTPPLPPPPQALSITNPSASVLFLLQRNPSNASSASAYSTATGRHRASRSSLSARFSGAQGGPGVQGGKGEIVFPGRFLPSPPPSSNVGIGEWKERKRDERERSMLYEGEARGRSEGRESAPGTGLAYLGLE
ncbi:hypothetical protein JCM8547_003636 [Rhodosporidiobolus lusitaniae]